MRKLGIGLIVLLILLFAGCKDDPAQPGTEYTHPAIYIKDSMGRCLRIKTTFTTSGSFGWMNIQEIPAGIPCNFAAGE